MRGLPAGPGGPLRKSNGRTREAAAASLSAARRKPEESPPPDDAVIPPPPSYASETEAREWDEYYRFCARGALFKALDRGRDAEDGAARRLAETMAELEAAPGWAALVGDVDDEADGEDADVAAEQAAEVDALDETRRKREAELAAVRRASGAEIAARLDAYDPVGPRAPGHEHRLRDLGLNEEERAAALEADAREAAAAPRAMKALVHEAALEALESLSAQTESQSLASGESASASSHSGKHHHHHRHHHKKAPGSPGSHHGSHHGHHHLPGASVAAEMAEIIKQDEHVASMMHELPSNPDGLIDAQTGKAQLMSEIVAEHTVRVDLSFPSLESFRRAEHDVASYFMPDYSAHLSEPHGGGGGFWSGVRAETRRARLAPDDESHSTGSHRRPRHGGAGHQRSHDADEVRAHGLEPALPGHQPAERPEASPTATLDTLLREGVACLATLPLPGLARDALESSQFAAAAAACAEAVAAALAADAAQREAPNASVVTGMPADDARPLIACAIAELVASPAAAMVVDAARAPTAYECDRYCSACAAATRAHFLSVAPEGSEVRPPPVSFAHLAAFCATAARLEHDSGMELVARSEKAALAADDALACLDEPGEHTVKGLLEQEGLLGPAQDKFRDFVTSPAFRAAVQAQTNKQLAKHGGLGAAAAWRVVLAARDALANQAAVRVDVAAATDPEDGADATARCFDIIEENKQHHHTQTVHHGRRRISIVDTASRFTEFATFALLRAALRERRDDARRDAAAELAYVDLARCPPSSEQGCLDVVHRLVDLGALPASAARLLGSAELARGLDAALARRDAQRARSSHHASAGPRGHQAWDATGRELKLVFDEVAAATDARLPTPKSPDRCALYGALRRPRRARGSPRTRPRALRLCAAARRARDVALRRRFGGARRARGGGRRGARGRGPRAGGAAPRGRGAVGLRRLRVRGDARAERGRGASECHGRARGAAGGARALRRAVVEAGAVYGAADVDADAADAADLDFSAAWVALAGRGVESMTPGDCAALLRPFATHWGGAPGAALAARAPRGGGDPADDAAARKVAALLAAATNGVVDATSLSLFVDDTSTDAGGSTAANFSSFHAQAERPVHRALRRVPIRHVTPPPDPRLHLAPASKFALLTSYALSALVFPGRAASSTTLDAADLPATVDQDRLPAELVRRATFDDSDLLEPLKLPRAAAANGN
ncbi:hypothetical protein JL721_7417 [Aureococcus anophagefferens]|nr:hypothetical protein JL721_7417 [Aureococcus anophagefferens]